MNNKLLSLATMLAYYNDDNTTEKKHKCLVSTDVFILESILRDLIQYNERNLKTYKNIVGAELPDGVSLNSLEYFSKYLNFININTYYMRDSCFYPSDIRIHLVRSKVPFIIAECNMKGNVKQFLKIKSVNGDSSYIVDDNRLNKEYLIGIDILHIVAVFYITNLS